MLKRFLYTQPQFIRLLNAAFAVAVGFNLIEVTGEQFGLVVLAVEAAFQYTSNVAFKKDVQDLYDASNGE